MNNNGPYDLEKLNPDKHRLAKRKKLLKRTIIFSVAGLIIAFKLMTPSVLTASALRAYNAKDFNNAILTLSPLKFFNFIESYKYHLNVGDAKFQKADYQGAEVRFRQAQRLVPKDKFCQITLNVILSIEMQADALVAKKDYDKAIERYDEIKALVIDSRCGSSDTEKEADKKAQSAEQRSSDKSDAAKKARNGDSTEKSSADQQQAQNQESQSITQDQTDKLESAEQKSSRLRQQSQQRKDSKQYDLKERKYDAKNW